MRVFRELFLFDFLASLFAGALGPLFVVLFDDFKKCRTIGHRQGIWSLFWGVGCVQFKIRLERITSENQEERKAEIRFSKKARGSSDSRRGVKAGPFPVQRFQIVSMRSDWTPPQPPLLCRFDYGAKMEQ